MRIHNVSPYGSLDVPLLGRVVEANECSEVTDAQAEKLLAQAENYAPCDCKPGKGEKE